MYVLLLLAIPFVFSLISVLLPGNLAKKSALLGSLLQFVFTLWIAIWVYPCTDLSIDLPWVASLGINFSLNIDGVSLILIVLTNLLCPIVIFSSFENRNYSEVPSFYMLVLLMQTALIGVFTAYDGFLFYVCWEAALIPIYFISAIWGGVDKVRITFKFFIYTVFGSLFMLAGLIYIYLKTPAPHSFGLDMFVTADLNSAEEFWVFLAFFIAFAIKMPIFPFHTWQPETYTESPTPATMLLSGIMLKMGIFGVMRWLIPIAPFAFNDLNYWIVALSVIGIVYASIIAIMQSDFKKLVAYSSIAHVGLISAGLFTGSIEGFQGAVIQMFNHGINVVAIFYVLELISQRTGTRQIANLGGIVFKAPMLSIAFLIIVLGTVALPLTNGFPGEFLLLFSVYKFNMWFGAIAGLTIILGAVYMLRMYKNIMLGSAKSNIDNFKDLNTSELAVLIPICILIIAIGLFPNVILQSTDSYAADLMQYVKENSFAGMVGLVK
ncbi:MAG: NADH-quinone oxidoreductase subunit M [Bacteroidota bacterium]|nr:NADH-quinone oxidoreductase subunit M [Bacteroidota bacterium]